MISVDARYGMISRLDRSWLHTYQENKSLHDDLETVSVHWAACKLLAFCEYAEAPMKRHFIEFIPFRYTSCNRSITKPRRTRLFEKPRTHWICFPIVSPARRKGQKERNKRNAKYQQNVDLNFDDGELYSYTKGMKPTYALIYCWLGVFTCLILAASAAVRFTTIFPRLHLI